MNCLVFISKYLKYKFFSRHRKAHGIHSPFLFKFINQVLLNKMEANELIMLNGSGRAAEIDPRFHLIDSCTIWGNLCTIEKKHQKEEISVWTVRNKFSNFLFNLYAFVDPEIVLEMGNGKGISAFCLSLPGDGRVKYIIEENGTIQKTSEDFYNKLNLSGVSYLQENQVDKIRVACENSKGNFLAMIHLDSEMEVLPEYFKSLVNNYSSHSVIVCSGIHKSELSEQNWKILQQVDNVRLTIDLFYLGILFFKEELQKENYMINF